MRARQTLTQLRRPLYLATKTSIMSKCSFLFLVVGIVLLIEFTLANKYGGGGHSNSHYDKHGHAYKFGYDITDNKGSKNSRHESDDGHGNRVSFF